MANVRNKTLDSIIAGVDEAATPAASDNPQELATIARTAALSNSKEIAFHQKLQAAPKERLFLSPQYRPFFGERMPVVLNGVPIWFPVNGMTYSVPKPYAAIIHARRRMVDDFLTRRNRLADVQGNLETYAGELQF